MSERDEGPYPEQEQEYRDSEGPQPCGQCECCEVGRRYFNQAMEQIEALRAENAKMKSGGECVWAEDEDGVWHTSCGHAFQFTTDGPAANGQKFCGYCGKRLREGEHHA